MPISPISSNGTLLNLDTNSSPVLQQQQPQQGGSIQLDSAVASSNAGHDRRQMRPVSASAGSAGSLQLGGPEQLAFTPSTRVVVVDHISGESLGLDSGRNFPGADATSMRSPYAGNTNGEAREGWSLTSALWLRDMEPEQQYLTLHAGPSQAGWSLPLRASGEPTKAGHSRFAQARKVARSGTNSGKTTTTTYYDLPTVSLDFQAGNLLPIPTFGGGAIPYGLKDFYRFIALVNQPPILPPGDKEGAPNFVTIFYTSLHFPNLYLKGYFEPTGISWTDTADSPTLLTWQASFLVYDSIPNLWEPDDLQDQYAAAMAGRQF